ncbi:cytochrome P450 [Streptomyces sp. NBC_01186]|uniref:cytochrome P450 family protein n=1 Tax=Streptomyces sp. NBC_01186 TaxID=2903765 RepID=UPI002E10E654|nr:cytochrome P450 [Streptomyces sp. NBC_01186]
MKESSPRDQQHPDRDAQPPAGPVQLVRSGSAGRAGYLVTGYAEARQALGDPRLSKDTAAFFADKDSTRRLHPAVTRNMLAVDPPQHTRLRKLVTKAFTTGAVAALRPFIEQVTDALLDRWPTAGQVDVVAELAMPLPVTVICELLGVPAADRADVRRWSADMFAAGQPERIDAASHAMAAFMTDLIAAKRDRPGDALLDQLIASRDGEDRLSEDELVALAVLLLVAGHETTTNFIGNALLALLRPPTERPSDQLSDQLSERPSDRPSEQFSSRPSERLSDLERLCREPDTLVPRALDELLRHGSPVSTATFRYTKEAITLGGTEIPAGAPVLVGIGAANRDPGRFPEPDQLDLGREDATGHLSFGHGIHRCVGAPLARAEAEIALRKVLTRFPGLRLAVPPEQLVRRPTRLVHGLTTLPVLT